MTLIRAGPVVRSDARATRGELRYCGNERAAAVLSDRALARRPEIRG
jgi:hypothetical protein